MKVMFLTQGVHAPSSRYRVEQLLPYFASAGVHASVRPAYGLGYNVVANTPLGGAYKALCRVKQAARTVRATSYDVVFLQKMSFPFTALAERTLALRNRRVVFDFDDAIYLAPNGSRSRARERAFRGVIGASAWVIAGNSHLVDVANAPGKTSLIPTTIDTARYVPSRKSQMAGPVVVGWMGTSGNFRYLSEVLPSVLAAVEQRDARLRIVSNATLDALAGHPRVEQVRWSADREIELLQSFDIGLMPLTDSLQARGKCGFKAIQYMAVACPVVASAVGANVDILRGSDAGVLMAPGDQNWSGAIRGLIDNSELRRKQGEAGRLRCVERYSAERAAEQYLDVFHRVARS